MMHCWECGKVVLVPSRENIPADEPHSQSDTVEVACPSCRTVYSITTTKMGRMVKTETRDTDEVERDRRKGWE